MRMVCSTTPSPSIGSAASDLATIELFEARLGYVSRYAASPLGLGIRGRPLITWTIFGGGGPKEVHVVYVGREGGNR